MKLLRWLWPRRRDIFAFWDGTRKRYADPLILLQALEEAGWEETIGAAMAATEVDKSKLSPVLRAQVEDKARLVGDLAATARAVFGVSMVDPETGAGLTQLECVGLLTDFLAWCADAGRDFRPLANLPARPANSPDDSDTGEYVVSTLIDTSSDENGP